MEQYRYCDILFRGCQRSRIFSAYITFRTNSNIKQNQQSKIWTFWRPINRFGKLAFTECLSLTRETGRRPALLEIYCNLCKQQRIHQCSFLLNRKVLHTATQRQQLAGFSPQRSGFNPWPAHVIFAMGQMVLVKVSLLVLRFHLVNIFPPVVHTPTSSTIYATQS